MDYLNTHQNQPQIPSHPLTSSIDHDQLELQPDTENPSPSIAGNGGYPHSAEGRSSPNGDLCPLHLRDEAPLTVYQQAKCVHCPGSRAASRLQILYRASRYIRKWAQSGYYEKDGWCENFKASTALCHGFELHPREVFQLLRFEFTPRFRPLLSDLELWKVVMASENIRHRKERGWLNTPGKQNHPMHPRAPMWFDSPGEINFWIPGLEDCNSWPQESRKAATPTQIDFVDNLVELRLGREYGAANGGPPLQDHPLCVSEIAEELGITPRRAAGHLTKLKQRGLLTSMDLRHVPGVYSRVLVPSQLN